MLKCLMEVHSFILLKSPKAVRLHIPILQMEMKLSHRHWARAWLWPKVVIPTQVPPQTPQHRTRQNQPRISNPQQDPFPCPQSGPQVVPYNDTPVPSGQSTSSLTDWLCFSLATQCIGLSSTKCFPTVSALGLVAYPHLSEIFHQGRSQLRGRLDLCPLRGNTQAKWLCLHIQSHDLGKKFFF